MIAQRITVHQSGQNFGPYSLDDINSMLTGGRVSMNDLAWVEGEPEWTRVGRLPGVRAVPPLRRDPPPAPSLPPLSRVRDESDRLVLPAFLLALFLGVLGIHRFYAGRTGSGVAMLILTFTGIGAIVSVPWAIVDTIVVACGSFRDDQERRLVRWV